jgi:magnesium chelatase subunit D
MRRSPTNRSTKKPAAFQSQAACPRQYPFAAIVGQAEMKLGLLLNVIDPGIGGVLMMGHRGTAKSTAVRALAELLPEISMVRGCAFNCDPSSGEGLCDDCRGRLKVKKLERRSGNIPVVDLPLGATEDRVCGSIDIQRALTDGVKAFEPGLLARANRGFLYIDEVNLLEDHLVDLLLDVAVTGQNKVERENISVTHPAHFVLIGSGNPEEGELRPQLLDRFGLYVEIKTENDPESRVEIVARRDAFERNGQEFVASFADHQTKLRRDIARAQRMLSQVKVSRELLRQIASLCAGLKVEGHRGELTIMRAARAHAALTGRKIVNGDDVRKVAVIALRHRLHRDALSEVATSTRIEQAVEKAFTKGSTSSKSISRSVGQSTNDGKHRFDPNGREGEEQNERTPFAGADGPELHALPMAQISARRPMSQPRVRPARAGQRVLNSKRGRYVQATRLRSAGQRLALDATIRLLLAAGLRGVREIDNKALLRATVSDSLRFKCFSGKRGATFIFAIDTSGSMAQDRIKQAKSAVLGLLKKSYINRDRVAIIAFRGKQAELLLPPSRSIVRARRVLDSLQMGGGTPLAAALACSLALAERSRNSDHGEQVLFLFTDGGANVLLKGQPPENRMHRDQMIAEEASALGSKLKDAGVRIILIETKNSSLLDSGARKLAASLGVPHFQIRAQDQIANISATGQIA